MACGRAVICSASGGAAELITEGKDALAHPPGDDAVLAERIDELVRNPELRSRLARAGRITAERRFERSRLAQELIPLYRKLSGHLAPKTEAQLAVTQ
jgi:glycosyltransferase involved in cell wall biosynthesis